MPRQSPETNPQASIADLHTYLESGNYTLLDEPYEDYRAICHALPPIDTPAMIAIDGPTNSGKSSFAHSLVDFYASQDVPVSSLPLDYFLVDRTERNEVFQAVAEGQLDIADYSHAAWRQYEYHASLTAAKDILTSARSQTLVIDHAYDRTTGKSDQQQTVDIHPGGVVIAEGVGLHAYHYDLFDMHIRADVQDDDMLLQRVLEREALKAPSLRLDDSYLDWRYNVIDRPHTTHLRRLSMQAADFVIDTTLFNAMLLYEHQ